MSQFKKNIKCAEITKFYSEKIPVEPPYSSVSSEFKIPVKLCKGKFRGPVLRFFLYSTHIGSESDWIFY